MLRRATIVACALSLALSGAVVASATSYTFTALPPTGSDTGTLGLAVNTVGGVPEVAGRSATSHPTWYNRGNAATFNSAGTETNISSYISGATYSSTTAIDSSGNVAGAVYVGSVYDAFYLSSGGTSATILPNLSSSGTGTDYHSMAFGMNAAGTVVGQSDAADNNIHAAVWTKSGSSWSVADLGTSGYNSAAFGINANGLVAGQLTTTAGYLDAATWTYNGSSWVATDLINRSLSAYATGTATALAVNDNGVAVGGGNLANFPTTTTNAYEFNANGTVTSLGNLGGQGAIINTPYNFPLSYVGGSNAALGINDSGVIVGESCINTSQSAYHAFIYGYQGNNTMQDMNTVFAGIIPANISYLACATSIDNNGDITGEAFTTSGAVEGFLLTAPAATPEPSTLLLAAAGLVGLLACAWRKQK